MGWLRRIIASRYTKSIARYFLVALAASMVEMPLLADLAKFITAHTDELSGLIAAILIGYAGTWSVIKNKSNGQLEKRTNVKVK